jgi:hypothetical protein
MMFKSVLILTLLASSAAGAVTIGQVAAPPELPPLVQRLLDAKYKGWKLATVTPSGCPDRMGASPALISADFNSDGFPDWALQIKTTGGVKLIAVMGYLQDFRIYELESSTDPEASRFLTIGHRGTKFTNPQTSLEDYFTNETIVTASCGRDRVAYLWVGFSFLKAVIPE